MPTISGKTSIAAGAINPNVLLGSQYELMPFDGTIEIGIHADSAGLVDCSIFSGPDVLAEPGTPVPFATTARFPVYPDDFQWEDEAAQGDRLKIALRSAATSGGPFTVFWSLRISPA